MKTFFVSLCLVILFALAHTPATAQTIPDCPIDYDCPWTVATAPQSFSIANGSNICNGKIYYCFRSCNGSYDVYIRAMVMDDAGCALGLDFETDIVPVALSAVYTYNPYNVGYTFNAPPCSTMVTYYHTIYTATCYKQDLNSTNGEVTLSACNSTYGCNTSWKMCWDYTLSPAKLKVEYDGLVSSSTPGCPTSSNPFIIGTTSTTCKAYCPH